MRRLAVAVAGAIVLAIVASASAALAISNSSWTGSGTVTVKIKVKGEKKRMGVGEFTAPLSVTDYGVNLAPQSVSFTPPLSGVTFTASGPLILDPTKFTVTNVRLDAASPPALLSVEDIVDNFTSLTAVTITAMVDSFSDPPSGAGLLVLRDTLDAGGSFKAIHDSTEVKGKVTIRFSGQVAGGENDGEPFKGTIVITFLGDRSSGGPCVEGVTVTIGGSPAALDPLKSASRYDVTTAVILSLDYDDTPSTPGGRLVLFLNLQTGGPTQGEVVAPVIASSPSGVTGAELIMDGPPLTGVLTIFNVEAVLSDGGTESIRMRFVSTDGTIVIDWCLPQEAVPFPP